MTDIVKTLAYLGDPQRQVQYRELRQLNDIGRDARQVFWEAWQPIDQQRRRELATTMAELAEENVEFDFRDVFVAILNDSDPEVRIAAVEGLWEDERRSTLERLLSMFEKDPENDVRAAVALVLGHFARRAGLQELKEADAEVLRQTLWKTASNFDVPDDIRRRSVEVLGYFGGDDVLQVIAQAYATGQRHFKESALTAMGHSLDPRWLPILEAELQSSEPALRYEAARASGELGPEAESLLPRLLPLAESDDGEVAQAAIWALGQIGGGTAKRTLRRLTRSDQPAKQEAATEALAELQFNEDPTIFE
jgi:HEAT repeat protein